MSNATAIIDTLHTIYLSDTARWLDTQTDLELDRLREEWALELEHEAWLAAVSADQDDELMQRCAATMAIDDGVCDVFCDAGERAEFEAWLDNLDDLV